MMKRLHGVSSYSVWPRLIGSILATLLILPFVAPVALTSRGLTLWRQIFMTKRAAPPASGDVSRIEWWLLIIGVLIQEEAFIPVIESLMGREPGADDASDPLSAAGSAFMLLITIFLCFKNHRKIIAAIKSNYVIVVLGILNIISAIWSVDPALTLKRGILTLGTMAFWLYIATRLSLSRIMQFLSIVSSICIIGSCLVVVLFPSVGKETEVALLGNWRGVFSHKNVLGNVMAVSIYIYIFEFITLKTKKIYSLFWVLMSFLMIILSHSSTSLLVATFGIVGGSAYLLMQRGAEGRFIVLTIAGVVGISGAIGTLINPNLPFLLLGRDSTLTGRTELWEYVRDLIAQKPLLGWGFGAMWTPTNLETTYIWNQIGWLAPEAHNGYLDTVLQLGVLGGFSLGLIGWVAIYRIIHSFNARRPELGMILMLMIIQQIFINLTETVFNQHQSFSWNVFLCLLSSVGMTFSSTHSRQFLRWDSDKL